MKDLVARIRLVVFAICTVSLLFIWWDISRTPGEFEYTVIEVNRLTEIIPEQVGSSLDKLKKIRDENKATLTKEELSWFDSNYSIFQDRKPELIEIASRAANFNRHKERRIVGKELYSKSITQSDARLIFDIYRNYKKHILDFDGLLAENGQLPATNHILFIFGDFFEIISTYNLGEHVELDEYLAYLKPGKSGFDMAQVSTLIEEEARSYLVVGVLIALLLYLLSTVITCRKMANRDQLGEAVTWVAFQNTRISTWIAFAWLALCMYPSYKVALTAIFVDSYLHTTGELVMLVAAFMVTVVLFAQIMREMDLAKDIFYGKAGSTSRSHATLMYLDLKNSRVTKHLLRIYRRFSVPRRRRMSKTLSE